MTEKQLFDLKKKVDDAKTSVAELNGQLTSLMQQLKKEWACNTIEEARQKLAKFKNEVESLEKRIADGIVEIEEKYNEIQQD